MASCHKLAEEGSLKNDANKLHFEQSIQDFAYAINPIFEKDQNQLVKTDIQTIKAAIKPLLVETRKTFLGNYW